MSEGMEKAGQVLELLPGAVRINGNPMTETGLRLKEKTTKEQWEEVGEQLKVMGKGNPWATGDWLLFAEGRWVKCIRGPRKSPDTDLRP